MNTIEELYSDFVESCIAQSRFLDKQVDFRNSFFFPPVFRVSKPSHPSRSRVPVVSTSDLVHGYDKTPDVCLLVGPPGSGKTSLLRYLTWKTAPRAFYVYSSHLMLHKRLSTAVLQSLMSIAASSGRLQGVKERQDEILEALEVLLKENDNILMMDDDLPDGGARSLLMAEELTHTTHFVSRIIVGTRWGEERDLYSPIVSQIYVIQRLNSEEEATFINMYLSLWRSPEHWSSIQPLLRNHHVKGNSLLLLLLCIYPGYQNTSSSPEKYTAFDAFEQIMDYELKGKTALSVLPFSTVKRLCGLVVYTVHVLREAFEGIPVTIGLLCNILENGIQIVLKHLGESVLHKLANACKVPVCSDLDARVILEYICRVTGMFYIYDRCDSGSADEAFFGSVHGQFSEYLVARHGFFSEESSGVSRKGHWKDVEDSVKTVCDSYVKLQDGWPIPWKGEKVICSRWWEYVHILLCDRWSGQTIGMMLLNEKQRKTVVSDWLRRVQGIGFDEMDWGMTRFQWMFRALTLSMARSQDVKNTGNSEDHSLFITTLEYIAQCLEYPDPSGPHRWIGLRHLRAHPKKHLLGALKESRRTLSGALRQCLRVGGSARESAITLAAEMNLDIVEDLKKDVISLLQDYSWKIRAAVLFFVFRMTTDRILKFSKIIDESLGDASFPVRDWAAALELKIDGSNSEALLASLSLSRESERERSGPSGSIASRADGMDLLKKGLSMDTDLMVEGNGNSSDGVVSHISICQAMEYLRNTLTTDEKLECCTTIRHFFNSKYPPSIRYTAALYLRSLGDASMAYADDILSFLVEYNPEKGGWEELLPLFAIDYLDAFGFDANTLFFVTLADLDLSYGGAFSLMPLMCTYSFARNSLIPTSSKMLFAAASSAMQNPRLWRRVHAPDSLIVAGEKCFKVGYEKRRKMGERLMFRAIEVLFEQKRESDPVFQQACLRYIECRTEMAKWIPDESVVSCMCCGESFTFVKRKHHCRRCGWIICSSCSKEDGKSLSMKLPLSGYVEKPVRVCSECYSDGKRAKESLFYSLIFAEKLRAHIPRNGKK